MRKGRTRARGHGRIRLLVAALLLLVALGVIAMVALATGPGTHGRRSGKRAAVGSRAARPSAGVRVHRRTTRLARSEERAIDAVLAYTPFVARGVPRHRVIALTFDDGPSPYTEAIVRILARMHVPATFFIVGQQLNDFSRGLVDEVDHGFSVADHTENHAWLIRLRPAAQYAQIHDVGARLRRLGAPFPRLFRPPYGAFNAKTLATLRQLRMLMVLWSVDPADWRRPGTARIVRVVLSTARPGAIVELHDGGGDRRQTVAALPAIINGLRRLHYQLVTVPQLLLLDPPPRHQKLPRLSGA